MSLALIGAAHVPTRGIGYKGKLPWNIPHEFKYFKDRTKGTSIIMGGNTFRDDLKRKPLAGRLNIVITQKPKEEYDRYKTTKVPSNLIFTSSLDPEIIKKCIHTQISSYPLDLVNVKNHDQLMVIGGQGIYTMLLPYADTVYLTEIYGEFQVDRYFPVLSPDFTLDMESDLHSHEAPDQTIYYRFMVYRR